MSGNVMEIKLFHDKALKMKMTLVLQFAMIYYWPFQVRQAHPSFFETQTSLRMLFRSQDTG